MYYKAKETKNETNEDVSVWFILIFFSSSTDQENINSLFIITLKT